MSRPTLPIVATIVWGLLIFPALVLAMFSPMMFDPPGSEKNAALWVGLWLILSIPVVCIVSIVASWIIWLKTKDSPSGGTRIWMLVSAGLPLVPSVALIVMASVQK